MLENHTSHTFGADLTPLCWHNRKGAAEVCQRCCADTQRQRVGYDGVERTLIDDVQRQFDDQAFADFSAPMHFDTVTLLCSSRRCRLILTNIVAMARVVRLQPPNASGYCDVSLLVDLMFCERRRALLNFLRHIFVASYLNGVGKFNSFTGTRRFACNCGDRYF